MEGGAFLLRTSCVLPLSLADVTPGKLAFFNCVALSFSSVTIVSLKERMSKPPDAVVFFFFFSQLM